MGCARGSFRERAAQSAEIKAAFCRVTAFSVFESEMFSAGYSAKSSRDKHIRRMVRYVKILACPATQLESARGISIRDTLRNSQNVGVAAG